MRRCASRFICSRTASVIRGWEPMSRTRYGRSGGNTSISMRRCAQGAGKASARPALAPSCSFLLRYFVRLALEPARDLLAREIELHPFAAQLHQAVQVADAGGARHLVEHRSRSIRHQQSRFGIVEANDDALLAGRAFDGVLRGFELFLRWSLLASGTKDRGSEERQRRSMDGHARAP